MAEETRGYGSGVWRRLTALPSGEAAGWVGAVGAKRAGGRGGKSGPRSL